MDDVILYIGLLFFYGIAEICFNDEKMTDEIYHDILQNNLFLSLPNIDLKRNDMSSKMFKILTQNALLI